VNIELPTLVGLRCTLRPLVPEDAASIARHADDEGVWRNLFEGFPRPYTMAHAEVWCGEEHRKPAYGHVWAIDVSGQAVGCCSVRQDAGGLRCNAEVGYWIGRAHWGRGIASEALALLTAWAWAQRPEVTRLYAPIFAWNAGSQAVARRCGYVKEADLPQSARKDGRVIDRVLFAAYRAVPASTV
jgi:[ribosomal protein S5]-alanine N-acetyltransferase